MRSEVIRADSVDAAVELILDQLKEGRRSRENVIYFDGWDGLGASAVLRSVAQRLADLEQFDQVVHVDCSKWESRRTLQRVIAEQLKLPADVVDTLNEQDEEDDFNGVAPSSRDEVLQVRDAMYERIGQLNHRFLVIFHNGNDKEIDLATFCGFPLFGYLGNRVLWTFQGRFRLKPRSKVDAAVTGVTDVFLSATNHKRDPQELWSDLVHLEAADLIVAAHLGHQPTQVAECFFYMWKLCSMVHVFFRTDYDLAMHCCGYWVCDGIVQEGQMGADDDGAWQASHTLQQEVRLDLDYHNRNMYQLLPSNRERFAENMASLPHWTSPTLPCSYTGTILSFPAGDYIKNLGVLKLSHCTFSFSSPPFCCCQRLRFLWLDHCKDDTKEINSADEAGKAEDCFFQRLWVLDVRYTCCDRILSAEMMNLMSQLRELNVVGARDWDMGQLQGRLPNIRKLRIKNSTINCNSSYSSKNCDLFPGMMDRMELLELSGNRIISGMESLTIEAKNSLLRTVIIEEGCFGLKQISIKGDNKLNILLLRGLFEDLESIDISGTEVKILDLRAVVANTLELISLHSDKLCRILWPQQLGRMGQAGSNLRIVTTGGTSGPSSLSVKYGNQEPIKYDWYVFVSDARLLRSLVHWKDYFKTNRIYMEVSSPAGLSDIGEEWRSAKSDVGNAPLYEAVAAIVTMKLQHPSKGNDDGDAPTTITQIWSCPRAFELRRNDCYMYIQDPLHQSMRNKLLEQGVKAAARGEEIIRTSSSSITVPEEINVNTVFILHMHDSRSITHAPCSLQGSTWRNLRWCRIERCPSLDCVFFMSAKEYKEAIFYWMRTLWSSQLPRARCIWNFDTPSAVLHLERISFDDLEFVHVDLCPRLTHVLPLSIKLMHGGRCLELLETLELVWCGDLRVVFPIILDNDEAQQQEEATTETMVRFPRLKHIHLHELPKLQGIWGCMNRMYAPQLESIKIRGCWSLMRLPAVAVGQMVECDCEKEWWDKLRWDDKTKWENVDVNHDPSFYKPTHPRHYKRRLVRTSILR